MAILRLNRSSLEHNYRYLDDLFTSRNIEWGVVSKLLCGNRLFISELLKLGVREIHDSRVSNLKVVKELDPSVQTVYIKPPPKRSLAEVVKYADVSFNTELETIKMLSDEAARQNKVHKVIIMVEMGDLREGVMGEDLIDFYAQIFDTPNIDVIGIGTNLNCMHGVMPTQDKMIQISLYKQLIEAKFNIKIPWVSAGTSVAIPLIVQNMRPMAVNHFRVGEALYFGNNLFNGKQIEGMKTDVFQLFAEIIEITEKPAVPIGYIGENVAGNTFDIESQDYGQMNLRAILDLGLLDIRPEHLIPDDPNISVADASSDMLIINFDDRKNQYKVGDMISFHVKYMGALSLLSSDYIEKQVI